MKDYIKNKNKKEKIILSIVFSIISVLLFIIGLFLYMPPKNFFPWIIFLILMFLLFSLKFYWWFCFCEQGTEFWKPEYKKKR
jgi:hypothetical protein